MKFLCPHFGMFGSKFYLDTFIGVEVSLLAPLYFLLKNCWIKATAITVVTITITRIYLTSCHSRNLVFLTSANVVVDKKSELSTILRHQIRHKTWNRSDKILIHGKRQNMKKHVQSLFNVIWNRIGANQRVYNLYSVSKCECKELSGLLFFDWKLANMQIIYM